MIKNIEMGIQVKYWIPIFILLLISAVSGYAQKKEIGGGIGVLSYTGDLSRNALKGPIKPAGTVFYRYNMRDHLSLKLSFVGGKLAGTDEKPIDAFSVVRASAFNIFLYEFAAGLEYYFLDFRSKNAPQNWSPYFYGGIGIFGMIGHQNKTATYSDIQLAVPLAFGVRYRASPKWSFSVEAGIRATFFDYIDNISEGDLFAKNYQYGNPEDNDKYYFAGVSLSYTFYSVLCPTLPIKQGYRRR
ncbi:MAG: porin family protein [Cyclobacteriaceae bacterium]|nr:porin family protein [Cyclobacteriaceae bacterium]